MRAIAAVLFVLLNASVVCSQSQRTLEAAEILKLIPTKLDGYSFREQPKGKLMKVGTLKYALAEQKFYDGNKKISILLFDYIEAPIMYDQATRKFSSFEPVVNDSTVLRSVDKPESLGWEKSNMWSKTSQILLGIHDRFYLILEGAYVTLDELNAVLEMMNVENFPRKN